jgi:hypothetical protein
MLGWRRHLPSYQTPVSAPPKKKRLAPKAPEIAGVTLVL